MRRSPLQPQQQPGLDEKSEQPTGPERDGRGEPGAEPELVRQLGRRQRADARAELIGEGDGREGERSSTRGPEGAHQGDLTGSNPVDEP